MKVSVSGKQFVWPRSCACCGSYKTESLTISGPEWNRRSRTQGWEWEIPYCRDCIDHIEQNDRINVGFFIAQALVVLAGFLLTVMTRHLRAGVEIAATFLAVACVVVAAFRFRLRKYQPQSCVGTSHAVKSLGSHGPCHSFDLRSPAYAAAFVRINPLKIVNASPWVASVLRQSGFKDYRIPRRLLRSKE